MLVLRCTRKLLNRLHLKPDGVEAASTTVLGDWYATVLVLRPAHLVLLVNVPTRLPVVLPAREISTLLDRIPDAVMKTLVDLGAPLSLAEKEGAAMREIQCATTRDRSVLGAMNEFVFQILLRLQDAPWDDLRALSLELSGVLIGIGKRDIVHPGDEVRRLLGLPRVRRRLIGPADPW
jgi:hypothetical protein